ncbi:MAG TPA: DnaJ domain-containing protein [Verrucomicrobiae bacterium]
MTDLFALLQVERRPNLDADRLKQQFLALSTPVHPDKIHSAPPAEKAAAATAFAALNTAHSTLTDPKARLGHLLELERGEKPLDIQTIPAGLADLFAEVANLCRATDDFLTERSRATSPLVQVQYFARSEEWADKLTVLQGKLAGLSTQLATRLETLDARWLAAAPEARAGQYPALEELYRLFSYFNRWHAQLQERLTQLSQFPLP